MSKYRVKLGMHVVSGLLRKKGDEFEDKAEGLDKGEGSRFFERVEQPPATATSTVTKEKGKPGPKPKGTAAGESVAPATAEGGAPAAG